MLPDGLSRTCPDTSTAYVRARAEQCRKWAAPTPPNNCANLAFTPHGRFITQLAPPRSQLVSAWRANSFVGLASCRREIRCVRRSLCAVAGGSAAEKHCEATPPPLQPETTDGARRPAAGFSSVSHSTSLWKQEEDVRMVRAGGAVLGDSKSLSQEKVRRPGPLTMIFLSIVPGSCGEDGDPFTVFAKLFGHLLSHLGLLVVHAPDCRHVLGLSRRATCLC